MKIRQGFISNSSSSSFIVNLDLFSPKLLREVDNKNLNLEEYEKWDIEIDYEKNLFKASTFMDNFDLREFLINRGISEEEIKYGN
jgi:hypothetical protein